MAYESRGEIDSKYKWDLSSMFPSDEAFEAGLEELKAYCPKLLAFKGKISTSAQALLEFLQLEDQMNLLLYKIINYAERKSDEDTRVAKYQAYVANATSVYTQAGEATSWFAAELLAIPAESVEKFYAEVPALEFYRRKLNKILNQREHTLSAEEEALLARAEELAVQPTNIFSMFDDADLIFDDAVDSEGKTHKLTSGSFVPLLMNGDRVLRESAFKQLYSRFGEFRNTSAAILTSQVKNLQFFSSSRKYASSLEAALAENEIPVEVYNNLIDAVHQNFPAFYKYVDLRKRVMGLDELHFWDVYTPLVDDVDMKFTYEEACDLIVKALAPMGEEYVGLVKKGLESRWVDVYETPGKRSGAYSAGGKGMNPVMLLNFQGGLDDVYTLIHEMGHSLHTYFSSHNQEITYSDYSIFVAEVASTCNEALLSHYLLEHETDPARHAYILNHFLEGFRGTIYRQCMFAEFERDINQMNADGVALNAEVLSERYGKLCAEYFGPGIELDEEIKLEWSRIPHFYYNFYVYQYCIGFSAAIALSQRILSKGEPAVKDYIGYLSGGCSKTPIELLRGAGVDMATPDPVNAALKYFGELVDQLEQELN
ncbi:oligoendopeptidase F [Lancefieldella parvula DSM 20469]|uniref:Oligopeptidase F n=1 Tax=Lancefieldella parvula (strain ATCC 33793 / DSM 20469 / CCUG 32760 / JCM 10300 / KCTC 3663 / VPI 0546 / 1246) TaxID=521095 RepID=C8W843_LANP1|nr:oligoendopeptidase F [Lancefieldella parvula]ACV51633.1 oligoendopeptidase F [Lancefieldella parvula DSM 20469]